MSGFLSMYFFCLFGDAYLSRYLSLDSMFQID